MNKEEIKKAAEHYATVEFGDPEKFEGLRECEKWDSCVESFTAGTQYARLKLVADILKVLRSLRLDKNGIALNVLKLSGIEPPE